VREEEEEVGDDARGSQDGESGQKCVPKGGEKPQIYWSFSLSPPALDVFFALYQEGEVQDGGDDGEGLVIPYDLKGGRDVEIFLPLHVKRP
jgi:hypothetical protein